MWGGTQRSELLQYWFNFRRQRRLELGEGPLLSGPKNVPCFDYDPSAGQFMDSPIVIGFLGMNQCLHRIDDLIFSVSLATLPGSYKVFCLAAITLGKRVNQCRNLPGRVREVLVYVTAEFKEWLNIFVFAAR
jgi:hypothetical protein